MSTIDYNCRGKSQPYSMPQHLPCNLICPALPFFQQVWGLPPPLHNNCTDHLTILYRRWGKTTSDWRCHDSLRMYIRRKNKDAKGTFFLEWYKRLNEKTLLFSFFHLTWLDGFTLVCSTLLCFALHCFAFCITLLCFALHCFALHYFTMFRIALHCFALLYLASLCFTLLYFALL